MAFDFGAALSSLGQIAPAMSEGAEIRRQRQADAADVSQRAQAAKDTHAERQAQTEREAALTQQDQRAANRFTPISSKPERGEDGKYYMLFLSPDNKIQRLPVEGDYDPLSSQKRIIEFAKQQGLPLTPEDEKQLLGIKPPSAASMTPLLRQGEDGNFYYVPKTPAQGAVTPVAGQNGQPFKGKMPPATTTRTGQHFYVDNDNNLREVPYTTTTTRGGMSPAARSATRPPNSAPGVASSPGATAGKVIGPSKLSTQERATLQTDQQITGFANEVLPQIEKAGLQQANGPTDSIRALAAWGEYKAGRVPTDPFYASIIRPVAAISIAGAAPWVRIGRNRYTFDVIQQHLPHPWQTPARIYDNVKWLRDNVVPSSERSILEPVSKAGRSNVIVVSPEDMAGGR